MNWNLVLMHGVKAFCFVVLGALVTVILGALTAALGYKPEGALAGVIWNYGVFPLIAGTIAAIENWWKHRSIAK